MTTKLAVLVPTRSRPQNISQMVDAWHATHAFVAADLFFVTDRDDARFVEYCAAIQGRPEATSISMATWEPLVPKLNRAAVWAAKRYRQVAFLGDDHLPRTDGWAHDLVAHYSASQPAIWYGRDGFQDRRLPTWWSMDSRIVQALGKMVPAPVQHLYCDNAVRELGERAECLGYDEDILIEHMHPVAGKGQTDAQYIRVNRQEQYQRDGAAFYSWLQDGADRDVSLVRNIGR